ncbi:DUF420 domain-containing protein [Myxococcota bacterium]|nr:DUF420 domain-containing protein [Myxococcota bacterium]
MSITDLPLVNACINTAVAVLLVWGYLLIKQGRREAHERAMLAAVGLSALFLASYLTYHFQHGSTKFQGEGAIRYVYFAILLSHTILAVVNLPFVIMTLLRALKRDFDAHKRIAKSTWAVWVYVAITGPLVYLMLYQLFPGAPSAEAAKVEHGAQPAPVEPSPEAKAAFEAALALHRQEKDREALAKYREASALGHLGARCYSATIAARLGEVKTATVTIEEVLAKDPTNRHCRVLEARALVNAQRSEEAIPLLEAVVREEPNNAFFHASLGYAYFRRMWYPKAAEAFEKSIAIDASMPANVFNAGYAHFLENELAKAKPLLERSLAQGLSGEPAERAREAVEVITGRAWVCPMHPEEIGKPGDTCSECGMKLQVSPKALKE